MSEAKKDESELSALLCGVDLTVRDSDSYEGKIILNSRIFCEFKVRNEDYKPKKLFEIGKIEDFYSETFLKVFKGAQLRGCIITGLEAAKSSRSLICR